MISFIVLIMCMVKCVSEISQNHQKLYVWCINIHEWTYTCRLYVVLFDIFQF